MAEPGQSHQSFLHCFKAFVCMKIDKGNPLHDDWQNLVNKADFQEHQLSASNPEIVKQAPAPLAVTSRGPAGANASFPPKIRDCVLKFKKVGSCLSASIVIKLDNKDGVDDVIDLNNESL